MKNIWRQSSSYLFLLLVEVVNDHTNEEVQGEEGPENDEDNKVDVHVNVDFIFGLVFHLERKEAECLDFKYVFIH